MLEFVEEALDEVALAVDREVDNAANADIGLAWDMSFGAAGLDQVDDGAGKEATICDHVVGQTQPQTVFEIMAKKGELALQQTLLRQHYHFSRVKHVRSLTVFLLTRAPAPSGR